LFSAVCHCVRGNKKGQSREIENIGYTKRIKVREYRRGNKKGQSREIENIGYTKR
jgi:predicted hydrolase (HD superfamily)